MKNSSLIDPSLVLASHGRLYQQVKPQINKVHLFNGEINKSGKPVGFHHRPGGKNPTNARVTSITDAADAMGVYRGKVEIFDPKTATWKEKGLKSTFFPDSWSDTKVVSEIESAFQNSTLTGKYWEGVSQSGVKLGGYLDDIGDINTAFPLWPQ